MPQDAALRQQGALRDLLIRAASTKTSGPERLEALKAAAAYLAREERIKFDVDGAQCTYDAPRRYLEVPEDGHVALTDGRGGAARWPFADELYVGLWCRPARIRQAILLRLEGVYGGGLTIAIMADGCLRADISEGGEKRSVLTLKGGMLTENTWSHVAFRIADDAKEMKRRHPVEVPKRRPSLLERRPSQKSGRLGVLAGGASLEVNGVVEDRDNVARAPSLSSPELRHADVAGDGYEGSVAGLVMLQRAPGRSSSCALAWRFTGDNSYDGASTLAQDAASGVARRTAQHLSPEPHTKKGFLSPMKRPSLDDDALEASIFDAEGSSGDARASLCSLGGAIENCSSEAAFTVRSKSRSIANAAAAAALRRGNDPVGALVCCLDGDRGSTASLKCAPRKCAVHASSRPRDALRCLGGASSIIPALAQLADTAVITEEQNSTESLRTRLLLVDGMIRCGTGDDFLRCGGVEILERCLDARASRDEDVGESLVKVLNGLLASTEGTSSKGDALLDRFVDRIACHAQLWSSETTSSVVGWCRSSARALQSVRDGVGLDAYAQRLAHALSSTHAASSYRYRSPHLSLTVPPSTEYEAIDAKDASVLEAVTALAALPVNARASIDGELHLDTTEAGRAVLQASLAMTDDQCATAALKGLQAFEPEALRSLCERGTVAQLVERGFSSQNDPLAVECLLLSVLFVGPDGTASTVETYWRRHETNVGPLALRALLKLSGSAVLRACSVAYARLGACERLDVLSYCASLEKTDADAADAACSAILIGDDAEPDPTPSADCTLLSLCAKRPPSQRDRACSVLCRYGTAEAIKSVAAYSLHRNDPRLVSRIIHTAHEHGLHSFIGAAPYVASVAQRGLVDVSINDEVKTATQLRRSLDDLAAKLETRPKRHERSGGAEPLPPVGVKAHPALAVYTSLQVAECLDVLLEGSGDVLTDDVEDAASRALERVAALDAALALDGCLLSRLATKDLVRVADRCKRNLERHRQACSDADVKVAERVAQRRGGAFPPSDDAGRASLLVLRDAHHALRLLKDDHKDEQRDKALVQMHALLVKACTQLTGRKRPVLPRHAQSAVQAMTQGNRVRASSFGDDWDQVVSSEVDDLERAAWLAEPLEVYVAGPDNEGRTAAFSSAADRRYNDSLKVLAELGTPSRSNDVVASPSRRASDAGRQLRRRDRKRARRSSIIVERAWRACMQQHRESGIWCLAEENSSPLIKGSRWILARHADSYGRRCFFVRDRDPVDVSKWAHQGGSTTVEPPAPPLIKGRSRVAREESSSSSDEDAVLIERGVPTQQPSTRQWRFVEDGGVVSVDDELFRDEHCLWVRGDANSIKGTLTVDGRCIKFTSTTDVKIWRLCTLERVAPRRYLLRRVAFEFFRCDSTSVFLALPRGKAHRQLAKLLKALLKRRKLPLLNRGYANGHAGRRIEGDDNGGLGHRDPEKALRLSRLTDLWRRRLLTNFAYLSALNELGGRTRQDLAQWPVFPWVLAFDSDAIDLGTGRDLAKPIGAQTEDRKALFLERYETFEDPSGYVPKFMYGSHYSSAGVVLHYLVRALPYSQLAVDLQGGRFDVPDRLFLGIEAAWRSTTNSMTDVKEVIPELYYAPEVLCNMNSLPLGKSQSGVQVDDVLLPAWCLNDPLQFIRVHRAALESDRVSDTLHLWIDLIFGDAQQGPKAVERANVFYHLTYEGAVNVEDIEDDEEREATDAQIAHFGQTPPRLFGSPHPRRKPASECASPLFLDVPLHGECPAVSCRAYVLDDVQNAQKLFGPDAPLGEKATQKNTFVKDVARFTKQLFTQKKKTAKEISPALCVALCSGGTEDVASVVCAFHADRGVSVWRWSEVPDGRGAPFSARPHGSGRLDVCARGDGDGNTVTALADRRVLTVGHSDGRVRLHDGRGRIRASIRGPHAGGSAVACCGHGHVAVTGGTDGVVAVWVCDDAALVDGLLHGDGVDDEGFEGEPVLAPSRSVVREDDSDDVLVCSHLLMGHASAITALAYSPVLDCSVSADVDGYLLVHACRSGRCLRSLQVVDRRESPPATKLAILDVDASVVVAASTTLALWSLNGGRRCVVTTPSPITSLATTRAGSAVVCGSLDGQLTVRRAVDLAAVHTIDLSTHGAPLSLAFGPDDRHLFACTSGGRVVVCSDPRSRLLQLDAALSNAVGLDTGLFAF